MAESDGIRFSLNSVRTISDVLLGLGFFSGKTFDRSPAVVLRASSAASRIV